MHVFVQLLFVLPVWVRKEARKAEEKNTDLQDIREQLRKMAFGKANDCVRLALGEYGDIDKLDLALLTEIKRNDKGGVELKLLDRTAILAQLAELAVQSGKDDSVRQLLQALRSEENE